MLKWTTCNLLLLVACGSELVGTEAHNHSGIEFDQKALDWAVERVLVAVPASPVRIEFIQRGSEEWTSEHDGLYFSSGRIKLVLAESCLANSALVHELIHYRLHYWFGRLEDHSEVDWLLVSPVNQELLERDSGCHNE